MRRFLSKISNESKKVNDQTLHEYKEAGSPPACDSYSPATEAETGVTAESNIEGDPAQAVAEELGRVMRPFLSKISNESKKVNDQTLHEYKEAGSPPACDSYSPATEAETGVTAESNIEGDPAQAVAEELGRVMRPFLSKISNESKKVNDQTLHEYKEAGSPPACDSYSPATEAETGVTAESNIEGDPAQAVAEEHGRVMRPFLSKISNESKKVNDQTLHEYKEAGSPPACDSCSPATEAETGVTAESNLEGDPAQAAAEERGRVMRRFLSRISTAFKKVNDPPSNGEGLQESGQRQPYRKTFLRRLMAMFSLGCCSAI
ncbi:uncharacterized protein [Paramormyrops kingsleyae]|uniref:uncharacterized protein n=1 Tax=Paramormyrops kingsleyae TaxID=1676925 RepID=UPI003B972365